MSLQKQSGVRALLCAAIVALLPLASWAGPVDVNHADARTLAKELTGIGAAKAQAIVDYRDKNGPFKNADDLRKVKGIGAKMLEKNRANIRLDKVAAEAGKKS
jgi:competence protein ComEA